MFNTRKISALLMALAMSLSLCVGAMASDTTVYELGSGVVAVVTVEDVGVRPRASVTNSGIAAPTAAHSYNFLTRNGDNARVWVTNDEDTDSAVKLQVSYDVTVNGETVTIEPKLVAPGKIAKINLTDNSGNGISGSIVTTVTAYRASSVSYTYELDQYWS